MKLWSRVGPRARPERHLGYKVSGGTSLSYCKNWSCLCRVLGAVYSLNHFSDKCPTFSLCAGPCKFCSRSCLRVKDSLKGKCLSLSCANAHSVLCKCSTSTCSKLRAVPADSLYHWQLTCLILVWPEGKDKPSISISNVTKNWKRTDIWTVRSQHHWNIWWWWGWPWQEASKEDTATKGQMGSWEINLKSWKDAFLSPCLLDHTF